MMTESERREIRREAAELAARYHWPEEARLIRQGAPVPDGFGREVGSNVALFLATDVLGMFDDARRERERQENRAHAKRLARLRVLIALLRLDARERQQQGEGR
jgi:hypothetical protein